MPRELPPIIESPYLPPDVAILVGYDETNLEPEFWSIPTPSGVVDVRVPESLAVIRWSDA